MDELNPYESPKEAEPLTTGQVVKRSVGVTAIILLTPPAVVVAAAGGCGISFGSRPPSILLVPLISAAIPFAALYGMMMWAVSVDRNEQCGPIQPSRRAVILAKVAPTFGVAQVLGLVLALGAFVPLSTAFGHYLPGVVVSLAISGLTPFVTLLFMLWRAWRAVD